MERDNNNPISYMGSILTPMAILEFELLSTIEADQTGPKNIAELQEKFQVTIKKQNEKINLSIDEYRVLFHLLYPAVLDFHKRIPEPGEPSELPKELIAWLNEGDSVGTWISFETPLTIVLEKLLERYRNIAVTPKKEEINQEEEIPF